MNSRDLETLEVDPRVPERIVPKIPPDIVAIWESGVSTKASHAARCSGLANGKSETTSKRTLTAWRASSSEGFSGTSKTLPCGSKVTLRYHGKTLTVPVIDRGPYAGNREYDLTSATKAKLGFPSTGTVLTTR